MTSRLTSMRTSLPKGMNTRPRVFLNVYGLLFVVAFSFLYFETFVDLVSDWNNNPNFSHGFLVPFIAGYLVWYRKETLKELTIEPAGIGLLVLGIGLSLFFVGTIGAELFVMRFSILVTLSGAILFCLGKAWAKELSVPVLYLLFMIPLPSIIWNRIAFPLQLMAASASAGSLSFIGIPVFREGNILHLATTSLEVVDACSGLRSLTTLLALGAAFAFISNLSICRKWILFLGSIPIAVFVNIVRLTGTGMMAVYIGPEAVHGFLHDMSGMVVFVVAMLMLYFMNQLLEQVKH